MRRKDRKCSTLIPGRRMGFSRQLPSILLVCVCGSANIASKGVPGTLKPFIRTLKSLFSTFKFKVFGKMFVIVASCEDFEDRKLYLKYDNMEVEVIFKTRSGVFDAGSCMRFTVIPTVIRRYFVRKSRGFVWLRHHHRNESYRLVVGGVSERIGHGLKVVFVPYRCHEDSSRQTRNDPVN